MLVVHLHFHSRTTGITKSIESILPFLGKYVNAKVFGYGIDAEKIGLQAFLRQVFGKDSLIIHAHRNNEIIFALFLRSLGGKFRLFATRHSETKPSGLTVYLMRKADIAIALTSSMAKDLPVKSKVVRHGVNTSVFKPGEKKLIPGVQQENLVSVIGRIRPTKGQADVLTAIAPLLKSNPGWGLVIIGKIDDRSYVRSLIAIAEQNKVLSQVHLVPSVKNTLDFYHASRAVVIASASEGFSLVCLEALSCGIVTVATQQVGVHSEVLDNGKNGYLFRYGDTEKLRSILSMIINDKVQFNAEEIRQAIVDNWDISKSAHELARIYGILTEKP